VSLVAVDAGFPAGCINIVTGYGHEWATRWRVTRASTIESWRPTVEPDPASGCRALCPVTLGDWSVEPLKSFLKTQTLTQLYLFWWERHRAKQRPDVRTGSRCLFSAASPATLLERLGKAIFKLRAGPPADLDLEPADPPKPTQERVPETS
jgi:aldehyde dehydrogenase (NAD+)